MLTVKRSQTLIILAGLLLVGQSLAGLVAAAEPPPGGGLGSVECGQSGQPGCGVTARRPGTASRSSGGAEAPAAVPGGAPGPGGDVDEDFAPVPAAPGAVAQLARGRFVLPGPVIRSSPSPGRLQLVWLPTWLWIDRSVWRARSATASVPGVSVTVTATPTRVVWSTGDGARVVCDGPGTRYTGAGDPLAGSPDCGHTYTFSSAGRPDGVFRVSATVVWRVAWSGGGESGTLAPLASSATAAFGVAESPAVNVPVGV